jgi:hypothetical protein
MRFSVEQTFLVEALALARAGALLPAALLAAGGDGGGRVSKWDNKGGARGRPRRRPGPGRRTG